MSARANALEPTHDDTEPPPDEPATANAEPAVQQSETIVEDPTKPDENGMSVSESGLSAGPSISTQQEPRQKSERDSDTQIRAQPGDYDSAGFAPRQAFEFQQGDFIRYMKEDGIIYQGYVQSGEPVEHGFNYYPGQDDDLVVKLNYNDGKHVAPLTIQQKDRIDVMQAKGQTMRGRNVETVSPDEIIAVSPEDEYDWYRVKEAWNEDDDQLLLTPD